MASLRAGLCAVGFVVATTGAMVIAQIPPGAIESRLAQAALDTAREGTVTHIPLDSGTGAVRGRLYDRFQLGVIAAKAAIAAGRTPSANVTTPGQGFVPLGLAVVALPIRCEGRVSAPTDVRMAIRLTPTTGTLVRAIATGSAAAAWLPGIDLPPQSRVVTFSNASLTDAVISIDYAEPLCPGEQKTVDIPVRTVSGRNSGGRSNLQLPPEFASLPSPTVVRVQALIDPTGMPRQPMAIQGPKELEAAAIEAFKSWRWEPARTNGVPVTQTWTMTINFTETGDAPPPAVPPAPASSFNDPTHDTTTPDLTGADRTTSRCPVATDASYGTTAANPIKVGGDVRGGPAREVNYLNVLRGPDGQGLRFRRTGTTPSSDGQTIIDRYEITHKGLTAPINLFLDLYHWEPPKAPAGFICGALIPLAAPAPVTTPSSPAVSGAGPASIVTEDQPGLSSATSKCPVAEDDTYGTSPANGIRIGPGADRPAREEQIMRAFRGPDGKGLRFRRTGSMLAPDQKTIVDIFEVSYAGLAQPLKLFFDRTQADTVKAPKGWACAQEIAK